jgi:predicted DsbA family dithiol-disulfide isomerase
VEASGADMPQFRADFESGRGRAPVIADYEAAIMRDRVRAIPTIMVEGGARLTGLVDLATYRKAIEGGR